MDAERAAPHGCLLASVPKRSRASAPKESVTPSPLRGEGREWGTRRGEAATKRTTTPKSLADQRPRKHPPLSSILSPQGRGGSPRHPSASSVTPIFLPAASPTPSPPPQTRTYR